MIDGNRADEAIVHLKHILGIYPKNIEAYRLLAKGLLERNRHLDAADVFQRVLSSVPDDFISHIGMAVVREDEGNMDAAIWHMERAYEVEPNSGPVQEELRRLYGRRDGTEPPKLRLTRAALARMYEKGDLYPQAIGELRAALADEPDRLDLKVMLATALWRSKLRAEAAETSTKIVEVLPYCREANRILADIWADSGRKAEAQAYRKRLESLDPYEAYADPAQNGAGALNVPPENVRIPRLETAPTERAFGAGEISRPDWMEALGIEYKQQPAAPAESGDWLTTLRGDTGVLPILPETAEAPDWLQSADEARQPASDWTSGLQPESAPAAEPSADDWLTRAADEGAQPPPAEGDIPSWMQEDISVSRPTPSRDSGGALSGVTGFLATMDEPPSAEAPDWLKGGEPSAMTADTEVPDWLTPSAPEPAATAETEVPEWLRGSEPSTEAAPTTAEIPDWLKASVSEPAPSAAAPEDVPAWLRADEAPPAVEGSVPDWLTPAEAEHPMTAEEKAKTMAATAEEIPEWMAAAGWVPRDPEKPLDTPTDFVEAEAEGEAEPQPEPAELPEWLQSMKPPEELRPPAKATGEAPEWLKEAMEGAGEEAPPLAAQPAAELPNWLAETPAAPQTAATPSPADMSGDEALAWLEGLAMKQGAKEEELVTKRTPEVPDWIRKPPAEEETSPAEPQAALPDWLRSPAEAETAPEAAAPEWLRAPAAPESAAPPVPDSGDEALAWLESLAAKHGAKPEELVTQPEARSEEMPEWMRETPEAAQPEPEPVSAPLPEPALPIPEAEKPDWLKQMEAESDQYEAMAKGAPTQPEPAPAVAAEDEALAWLESLAAKHGAKPEELVTQPEARVEETPAWIREAQAAPEPPAEPAPVEPAPAAAPTPEPEPLPAWLTVEPEPGIPEPPVWLEAAEPKHAPPAAEPEPLPAWLTEPEPAPAEPATETPEWIPAVAAPEPIPVAELPAAEQPAKPKPPAKPKAGKPAKPKAPRARPAKPAKLRSTEEPAIVLALARQHLSETKFEESIQVYGELIHTGHLLPDVIADLEAAAEKNPGTPELLRALGDAYMRDNQLQLALDTYKRALQQL